MPLKVFDSKDAIYFSDEQTRWLNTLEPFKKLLIILASNLSSITKKPIALLANQQNQSSVQLH